MRYKDLLERLGHRPSQAEAWQLIKTCTDTWLPPYAIGPAINMMPYSINLQAKCDPESLGFPVVWSGSRLKIPRLSFIAVFDPYYREGKSDDNRIEAAL